jgi:pimeloyl-ACP methyl ester carboxylesterase
VIGMTTDDIKPFRVEIDEAELVDLRERLARTRWPDRGVVDDWAHGIPLAYVQELCRYWAEEYDWRRAEARLNQHPGFRTEIDGLAIHFLHVRSPHEGALPLVMTHGWPGSVVEFLKVIGPLTDPPAHGGAARDAFHLVLPSLPGYGFSDKPTEPGWGVARIADAWAELMARLGYGSYGAQGGDWGAFVTMSLSQQDTAHLVGIHLSTAIASPKALMALRELTESEQESLSDLSDFTTWEAGYSKQQSTRPQTLGYGLVDSPAAQAAWIVEKFYAWSDCDGHPENAFTRDELLDNVMMYWLPGTGASSARLYRENFKGVTGTFEPVNAPTGYSVFPKEVARLSRRWAETRYTDLRYYNVVDRGGHFAAFEQPMLFVDEVRAAFRHMR